MRATISALVEAGITVEERKDSLFVEASNGMGPLNISTAPYPGFATDMQAQFCVLNALADGVYPEPREPEKCVPAWRRERDAAREAKLAVAD